MLVQLNNLYLSPILPGDCLCQPLKKYNEFFAKHIDNSPCWAKIALTIAKYVLAIIVYPLAGALAGIGLLVKYSNVSTLKQHSHSMKKAYRGELGIIQNYEFNLEAGSGTSFAGMKPYNELPQLHSVLLTKENYRDKEFIDGVLKEVDKIIDEQAAKYRVTAHYCGPEYVKGQIVGNRYCMVLGEWDPRW